MLAIDVEAGSSGIELESGVGRKKVCLIRSLGGKRRRGNFDPVC